LTASFGACELAPTSVPEGSPNDLAIRQASKQASTVAVAALLLAALGAAPASAADIQVGYRVDAKLLKKNTPAGTPLSFQLFTDSTCATSAGAPQVANAEAVTLIEQPRLIKVKGGPTRPSVAGIRWTLTGITPQPAFYAQVTGTGIAPVGGACQLQTASVGGTLPPPLPACPPDSVKSGNLCVDTYEASVWDIPPAQTAVIQKVKDGTVTLADLSGAGATQKGAATGTFSCTGTEYGPTFPNDGNYTAPLYVASIPGVKPSTCISAYQAKAACEIAGKRLMSNAEWVAAATGTPDTDSDNGTTDCNAFDFAPGPVNAGSRSACLSTAGAYDMIGNVWEWSEGAFGTAWFRGGAWSDGSLASVLSAFQFGPSFQNDNIGFRCAR